MTSMLLLHVAPAMTFGNWFSPLMRCRDFTAAMTILNTAGPFRSNDAGQEGPDLDRPTSQLKRA
jgi:hypothetical protein